MGEVGWQGCGSGGWRGVAGIAQGGAGSWGAMGGLEHGVVPRSALASTSSTDLLTYFLTYLLTYLITQTLQRISEHVLYRLLEVRNDVAGEPNTEHLALEKT